MKSVTLFATLVLVSILGGLAALNYYVRQKQQPEHIVASSRPYVVDTLLGQPSPKDTSMLSEGMPAKPAEATPSGAKIEATNDNPPKDRKGAETLSSGLTQGLFYVIVGSFTDEKNAQSAQKALPTLKTSILKDGKYYRVSAGTFPNATTAKQFMRELQQKSVESILLQP